MSLGAREGRPVAVKLFQESHFRVPTGLGDFPNCGDDSAYRRGWLFGTEMTQRETWAYKTLQDLQGSFVPHLYGAFVVCSTFFQSLCSDLIFLVVFIAQRRRSGWYRPGALARDQIIFLRTHHRAQQGRLNEPGEQILALTVPAPS